VLVKWFRQEEVFGERALTLRNAYLDGLIAITLPALAAYELANVLHYRKDLTTDQVQDAVQSLFDMEMAWVEPVPALMSRVIEIARSFDITVYDAAFVALAEGMDAVSITADERLARRLERLPYVRFLGEI
jgi:predicted nucleic acid-binding protein